MLDSIRNVTVNTYKVPTDLPESDGTLKWHSTTVVAVRVSDGKQIGLGWTYTAAAAADIVRDVLTDVVVGRPVTAVEASWQAMNVALRNDNRGGLCAMALSAVDIALWDLKARSMQMSLVDLIGQVREGVDLYGSGGFTSYDDATLAKQFSGWVGDGIKRVKMKVGRDAAADPHRVRVARQAIGDSTELFVDANGAYSRTQALALAERFAGDANVVWFEEPVSSDDLEGLRWLRGRMPAGMDAAAGEYGDTPIYFRRMLDAQSVDCLQADATRCGGFTGFLKAAALCEAAEIPLSAHCGPQLHAHIGCCVKPLRHVEYFHDHVRCDPLLFDGVLTPKDGRLIPDATRNGHGFSLNETNASRYAI